MTVMWVHAAFASDVALPGGFFTVDVFFVLSAFLITALLVAEYHARDAIDLKKFYARRALRLVPALLGVLVLVLVLRLTVGPVGSGLIPQVIATLLYVGNWFQVFNPTHVNYLDHTWSLAVEEQFYFLWPLTLVICLKRGMTPVRMAKWTAGVAVFAFAARWTAYSIWPGDPIDGFKTYYVNTFARADELLIGVTLGLLPREVWRRVGRFAVPGFLGLLVLIYYGRLRAPLIYEWGLTASAVCSIAVVAASADDSGPIAKLLSWRPFVAAGTISYGLYLYHLPIVLALFTYDLSIPTRIALGMLLPFPIAIASWFWLEKPALRQKKRFQPERKPA